MPVKYVQFVVHHSVENLRDCKHVDVVPRGVEKKSTMRVSRCIINFRGINAKLWKIRSVYLRGSITTHTRGIDRGSLTVILSSVSTSI